MSNSQQYETVTMSHLFHLLLSCLLRALFCMAAFRVRGGGDDGLGQSQPNIMWSGAIFSDKNNKNSGVLGHLEVWGNISHKK